MKKVIIISLAILSAIVISSCDLLGITTQEEDPAGQSPVKEASNVVEEKPQEENAQAVTAENEAQVEEVIRPEGPAGPLDYIYPPFKDVYLADTSVDIDTARKYFKEGVSLFEDGEYLLSEYYLNQIKDDYPVLEDHVYYYLAKCTLMQEKYDISANAYSRLINDLRDSIFYEKALLEYADLYFITEDYIEAENRYKVFIDSFPVSGLIPYATNQYAVCQERNARYSEAIGSYRTLYLYYPLSEYADQAYVNIKYLEDQNDLEAFIPSNQQVLDRAELFFGAYVYELAIDEISSLLDDGPRQASLSEEQHARALFKLGMCYYNMRDYSACRDYLARGYGSFPGSSYADDYLYFLGRAYTNLDDDSRAIENYDILITSYPNSNYADDALYRKGRIYFFNKDYANALINYQNIINGYPAGDRTTEAYWESGWIQYSSGDFTAARDTFDAMSKAFSGTSLEEKALFWQAKSLQKLNAPEEATGIYMDLVARGSYSYYMFASSKILEGQGVDHSIAGIDTSVYPHNPDIEELLPKVYGGIERSKSGTYGVITHLDKAKELLGFEFYESASRELEKSSAGLEGNPVDILQISTLYLKAKDYINSQKVINSYYTKLKNGLEHPYIDYFYYMLYPYGFKEYVDYYSIKNEVDPLFTLAVIREESRFQPDAGSFAGALGLMQIIPSTGQGIASALGISGFDSSMLLDPETSIKMGTYYLREQLDNFDDNKYFTCGAYNGGPGAMSRWINENWNGDIDEFIENISYDETRNYVKKVMGSYFFYSMIY